MTKEEKKSALLLFQEQLILGIQTDNEIVNISLVQWPKGASGVKNVIVRFKGQDIFTGESIDPGKACEVHSLLKVGGKEISFRHYGKFILDPYLCFDDGSELRLEALNFFAEFQMIPETKPTCRLILKESKRGVKLQITGECKAYVAANLWFKYKDRYFKYPKTFRNDDNYSLFIPGAAKRDIANDSKLLSPYIDFKEE